MMFLLSLNMPHNDSISMFQMSQMKSTHVMEIENLRRQFSGSENRRIPEEQPKSSFVDRNKNNQVDIPDLRALQLMYSWTYYWNLVGTNLELLDPSSLGSPSEPNY